MSNQICFHFVLEDFHNTSSSKMSKISTILPFEYVYRTLVFSVGDYNKKKQEAKPPEDLGRWCHLISREKLPLWISIFLF